MSITQMTQQEFSVETVPENLILSIHEDSLNWRVSDVLKEVRQNLTDKSERNIVIILADVRELSDRILKIIWQLARTSRLNRTRLQCIVPNSIPAPSLQILAANGMIELLDHRDWVIAELESTSMYDSACRESFAW